MTRPNVLLISTDQQRYDSLGCYGSRAANTPNLDRLAAEGALFERCYVNNPICTPSRASMLTGKTLPGHGVYQLNDRLPADEVLFTKRLQDAGYTTALFGKLHVSGKICEAEGRHPNDGFDILEWCLEPSLQMECECQAYAQWLEANHPEWHARLLAERRNLKGIPPECHMTHWAAERTIDFLASRDGSEPFFCMMSIFDPHNPYDDYPDGAERAIDSDAIEKPVVRPNGFDDIPSDIRREHLNSVMGGFSRFSEADIHTMRLGYHASVAFADREIGRVLDVLESSGMAEDTLVIFTSDHGDMLGDHGLLVKGAFFYDACTRVPLLMRWPSRIPAGTRAAGLVQLHDIAATVLSAAGLSAESISGAMPDSRDILPVATGVADTARSAAVCCYRNSGLSSEPSASLYWDPPIHATMIRDDRWKLNMYHGEQANGIAGELYDMQSDPGELNNLWNDGTHHQTQSRLMADMIAWMAEQELRHGSRGGSAVPPRKNDLTKPRERGTKHC
jgi:arylsulfatase